MTGLCRVRLETIKHDQDNEIAQLQMDSYVTQAWDEFWAGELNDLVDEFISDNPIDARNIALHAIFPKKFVAFSPSENDFETMIGQVIERRVEVLAS